MALLTKRQDAANAQVSEAGRRIPLVCIDIEYLMGRLDADRPVICFLSLSVFPHRISTVSELARHFLTELRAIRPEGPYHLTGYCFGAIVALEMARLLDEGGRRIESLVLMEPSYPGGKAPLSFRASRRLRQIVRRPAEAMDYFVTKMKGKSPGRVVDAPAGYGGPNGEFLGAMDMRRGRPSVPSVSRASDDPRR